MLSFIGLYMVFTNNIILAEDNINGHPGHLKPFGTGKSIPIDGFDGFPSPKQFHLQYVQRHKPLKMRGAAKIFPCHKLWDDDYFLNLDIGKKRSSFIHVETKKKEDREQETDLMHFHDFLKIYNRTEHYMVQTVPPFLRNDVLVPWPLQCFKYSEKIVDMIMWFSSGGTKSVVHTDDVDNMNCLIRGQKTFVLVDPKYSKFVPLNKNNNTYSSLDVDSVDFNKYKDMDKVLSYHHIQMQPGDCLYIPKRWIHQVRSFNRNIAVNFWWDSDGVTYTSDMWEKDCSKKADPSWTASKAQIIGLETMEFIHHLKAMILNSNVTLDPEAFIHASNQHADELEKEIGNGFKLQLNQVFLIGDKDKDLLLTPDDIPLWTVDDMKRMDIYYRRYERILQAFDEHMRQNGPGHGEHEAMQEDLPPEYRGLHEEL